MLCNISQNAMGQTPGGGGGTLPGPAGGGYLPGGEGYPAGGYPARGVPCGGALPGGTLQGGTLPGKGTQLGQQKE